MRILVVEDEPTLLRTISGRVKESGYGVDGVADGETAWEYLRRVDYDCVILDLLLPQLDGHEVLRRIRSKKLDIPVLVLTAMDSVEDRVKGLDGGADDYLVKPFSLDELLARIRALVRRKTGPRENVIEVSDLRMDVVARTVVRGGRMIDLTAKEFAILEYLLRNKDRSVTRSQIIDHVWSYNFDYGTNIVDVYIRYIRRKIDDDFDIKLIRTMRGIGYTIRSER